MSQSTDIAIGELQFTFSMETTGDEPLDLSVSVDPVDHLEDTHVVRFVAERPDCTPFTVRNLSIRWTVPAVDMHGLYAGPPSPEMLAKLPYWQVHTDVCANRGFPFVALFHRGGENRAAFGLIDQLTETALDAEFLLHDGN